MLRATALIVSLSQIPGARAYTYDTVQKWKAPLTGTGADGNPVGCSSGCARWAQLAADGSMVNQTTADALWRSRETQLAAGSSCAQPGGSPFADEAQAAGYAGSWCFCAHPGLASPVASYCGSPVDRNVPEQINLLLTGATTATVAFVTFGGRECCLIRAHARLTHQFSGCAEAAPRNVLYRQQQLGSSCRVRHGPDA